MEERVADNTWGYIGGTASSSTVWSSDSSGWIDGGYITIPPETQQYESKQVTIDSDGNIVAAEFDKDDLQYHWINIADDEKERLRKKLDLLNEVLMKVMNEIIIREYKISNNLKNEISSLLIAADDIDEEKEDGGFISKKDILI